MLFWSISQVQFATKLCKKILVHHTTSKCIIAYSAKCIKKFKCGFEICNLKIGFYEI